MRRVLETLTLSLCLFAVGCGASPESGGKSELRQGLDASGATPAPVQVSASPSPAPDLNCAGIMLHGDHTTCDEGDVDVADGKVPTTDNPVVPTPTPNVAVVTPAPTGMPGAKPTAAPSAKPVATPTPNSNIVAFHITAGTGTKPWNTAATAVNVKVGQTLRLYNDDTVTHRMHTNGAPCLHGNNFAPGTTADCVIASPIDTVAMPGNVYDHIGGPTALFYIKAVK